MGLKISTEHYRNNPWINTEPLSMPLFHISALCVTLQRYMSFSCQKTCCTLSRRLVRRFGHTPSVTVMRRSHPRRIVTRSAGVCSVGVCRGFSGLEGSVPRTPGAGWAPQGRLRVVEGRREGRTSGWLFLRWRSGGCAILLRRYSSSPADGELTTSSGTMLRCQAMSIGCTCSAAVVLASLLSGLVGRRLSRYPSVAGTGGLEENERICILLHAAYM